MPHPCMLRTQINRGKQKECTLTRSEWGRGGGGHARGQNTVCWCHSWPGSGIWHRLLAAFTYIIHVIRSAIWIRLQIQSEVWHHFCSKCGNYQSSVFTDHNSVFRNSRLTYNSTLQVQVQQKWTMFSPTASHAGWPSIFLFLNSLILIQYCSPSSAQKFSLVIV